MSKISGVYCICNRVSGELYVGHAFDIVMRWYQHRKCLRNGTRLSHRFLKAWRTFGEGAFEFIIVEAIENPTVELLEVREQHYLDTWAPEYNVARFAHGVASKARVLMSNRKKGNTNRRPDPSKCGNGLHQWIQGQLECGECRKLQLKRSYRKKVRHPPVSHSERMTPEVRGKISAALRDDSADSKVTRWRRAKEQPGYVPRSERPKVMTPGAIAQRRYRERHAGQEEPASLGG